MSSYMDEQRIKFLIEHEIRKNITMHIEEKSDMYDGSKQTTVKVKYKDETVSSDYFYVDTK